jgi:hypothetical protein
VRSSTNCGASPRRWSRERGSGARAEHHGGARTERHGDARAVAGPVSDARDHTHLRPGAITVIERSQTFTDSAPTADTVPAVVLSAEARHAILDLDLSVDREAGGWLVGHENGDEITIETAYGSRGSDYAGEARIVRLSGEWMAVIDEKAQRCGWKIIGDWHTHPQSDTGPSVRDTDAWLEQAAGLRQDYIGLLLCPNRDAIEDRFARPQWRAYLATEGGSLREVPLCFELSKDGA